MQVSPDDIALWLDTNELVILTKQERTDPLEGLIAGLVDQDSTRNLPSELNQTLAELRAAVEALRDGGLVENANATLSATRNAAEAISQASSTLPDLAARLSQAAAQASETFADFDSSSDFSRDFAAAIEQLDAAALAVERLARQIARDPNSLLTGR